MLLDIVVIVLRETLEASVVIGVLLSLSRHSRIGFGWLFPALAMGIAGAWLYGANLAVISEAFDYTGQELLNAGLQYLIYLQLLLIVLLQYFCPGPACASLRPLLVLSVACAVSREGSEIFVFYAGYLQGGGNLASVFTSGFMGLAVGMSAGAIAYYVCVSLEPRAARRAQSLLLILIAAGMTLQATGLLIQSDWISAGRVLWDSDPLLEERSIVGQLLYAVFGYESTPTSVEVIVYCLALSAMTLAALVGSSSRRRGGASEVMA